MAVALLLGGCASRPTDPSAATPEAAWAQGRLAVRVAAWGGTPARSETAAFELRGNGLQGELRLSTPLGNLLAVATWSPTQVMLTTPQGPQSFDTLAELSRHALGEELPLQALPDWLRGQPWAGAAHHRGDALFEQLGWRIELARLADGLLVATREAAPRVSLRVQLER